MKLKTLKDIEEYVYDFRDAADDIRREAIAWIKADEHKDIDKGNNVSVAMCNSKHRCEKCDWIKHFFNLKEEDLK